MTRLVPPAVLARAGIAPDSSVVVLGRGLQGEGEEGRIAWMLAYLGVPNIQFANIGFAEASTHERT